MTPRLSGHFSIFGLVSLCSSLPLRIACVAWRFWLGALSNIGGRSGGRGLRNREEIGARTTETMES